MENKFPGDVSKALEEISKEYNIKLKKETHYDANNRVLEWFGENRLCRLDINYNSSKSSLTITCYIDQFNVSLFFFKILAWCHDYIPNFPYLAKITWHKFDEITLKHNKDEYKNILETYIKKATELDVSVIY